MGSYGLGMAALAAAFTATDCLVEGIRRMAPFFKSSAIYCFLLLIFTSALM